MHAFYFGNSDKPLYGVSHPPTSNNYRNSAILICNSIGHEYIRSHRALRQLANRLADLGYYVMRFDYTGVGDSSGDFNNVSLSDWKNDINLASEELKAISAQDRISVIGLRIGATLSLMASSQCDFNNIIMLDPVTSGKHFTDNLELLQKRLLVDPDWFAQERSMNDMLENEYLGYKYSSNVIQELNSLFYSKFDIPDYQLLSTINTSNDEKYSMKKYFQDNTYDYTEEYIEDMGDWEELSYIDTSLTLNHVSNHICDILK